MSKETIIVAGYGPVGKAIANALTTNFKFNVLIVDPNVESTMDKKIYDSVIEAYETSNVESISGVIVCVATPMREDGSCNYTNVIDVCEEAKYMSNSMPILIKSTTDIEVLETLSQEYLITFSPEFISSSTVSNTNVQYLSHTFEIYGSNHFGQCRYWESVFRDAGLERDHWVRSNLFDAAFAKYVENSYLATRVTFFNEMYKAYLHIKDKVEPDNETSFVEMARILGFDNRIGRSHNQVPGPDGQYGYGGHCLPKDTNALIYTAKEAGYDMEFLKFVDQLNKKYRGIE